jgi:hypothetical protein
LLFKRAFTKLRTATTSFVMSVCLPARPHENPQLKPDTFTLNLIWDFSKICRANTSPIEILQELPLLYIQIYLHLWRHLAEFFSEWEMFQRKVIQKIKTRFFMFSNFSLKILPFMRHMEKYSRAGQAAEDDIIRRMRFACCTTKATNTHSEYVIFIHFLQPQRLRERASMLRYTYTACFTYINPQPRYVSTKSDQLHANYTLITATTSAQ